MDEESTEISAPLPLNPLLVVIKKLIKTIRGEERKIIDLKDSRDNDHHGRYHRMFEYIASSERRKPESYFEHRTF